MGSSSSTARPKTATWTELMLDGSYGKTNSFLLNFRFNVIECVRFLGLSDSKLIPSGFSQSGGFSQAEAVEPEATPVSTAPPTTPPTPVTAAVTAAPDAPAGPDAPDSPAVDAQAIGFGLALAAENAFLSRHTIKTFFAFLGSRFL